MDWITHEEDVWFDFRGSSPDQLVSGRYYKGTVDGFADFGVFVDLSPGVTGLLHRSELDRRLESLDWESGDTVFVQVKNVRDNGNVDLSWSIRQSDSEFRGARIHDPEGDADGDPIETDESDDDESGPVRTTPTPAPSENGEAEDVSEESTSESASESESTPDADTESDSASTDDETAETEAEAETEPQSGPEATGDTDRVDVDALDDHVGDTVRLEGEIVSVRQTSGPTVFELRDASGVVDCAAFVEAGVRAYPDVEVGSIVRLDGEVELRYDELQVETEALSILSDDEAATVERRLADALTDEARPDAVTPLVDHDAIDAVADDLIDAAETVRRAVLESRPVVVRHAATADGYVAGAAIERAVLPLIREEYATADAEYHYFTRRPLEGSVYDMDDATNDVTRMLQDRDRHDEKLPLVLLVGTGSTVESSDGLGLLGIYGARRVVVDAEVADAAAADDCDAIVNPGLAGADASDLSTGTLAATLAATVNEDVEGDLSHLPAVSYWGDAPEAYVDLASEAGYDADRTRELREAIALEAYYQSYEDKRELITDLLFEDAGGLAGHISEQFRQKLDAEVDTATANVDTREEGGLTVEVLDTDAYTHRFDFPPTGLLLDELHRRRADGAHLIVGVGTDELYLRTDADLDVRGVAADAAELVDDAGITAASIRDGRIEFLSGRRDDAVDAVVDAAVDRLA
ncbi:RecJ-like exonuclease, contains DnaJ-type Zn finger domain [Haloplanus vescus]|uniref:RecJ-like exonuclease, contains DnaJ-type Zn finger domain n=1 Tax=Haloplanus vescus TaxID=555874 RepID=A0A1H3YJQ7_9EURY|nr:OB-fold nucleic acid binding domain-containing protein [Haloplanus vescus]SEA11707.1 RecJ-like exonuclease, contains DnaJ-type Zn finger domain [Haloplanus vescus]